MVLGGDRGAARVVAAKDVLIQSELDGGERCVAVVVELDRLAAGNGRRRRVEANVDRVFHPELPVLASRLAGRVARARGERTSDRVRERNVAAYGARWRLCRDGRANHWNNKQGDQRRERGTTNHGVKSGMESSKTR